jgi:prepilin-type N-terminal cleavage/methylation domain-containing protein
MRFAGNKSIKVIILKDDSQRGAIGMKSKGFTLIELMVVVAIIGILASATLPTLSGLTDKAKVVKAQSELESIGTAILAYRNDRGQWPMDSNNDGWNDACYIGRTVRGGCGYGAYCLMPTAYGYTRYLNRDVTQSPWGGGCSTYVWKSRPDGWYAFVGCYGPNLGRETCFTTTRAAAGDDLVFYLE